MRHLTRLGAALALASTTLAGSARAAELGGSLSSMKQQHEVAVQLNYTFLRTPAEVRDHVARGRLEILEGNGDFVVLPTVSFPYARAEVRMFVERLAGDYRAATGKQLVVTSLTRPEALQPRNAHELSVHPTGMAVDFRMPGDSASRRWLETTLLSMEKHGVLDVTRERYPPHYHVAVFPKPYREYAKRRDAADAVAAAMQATTLAASAAAIAPAAGAGAQARFALPVNPVLGGAASGVVVLAMLGLGSALASARRRRGRR